MTSGVALLLGLAAAAPTARNEFVRRGYELLPDARWLEELERDRDATFLGLDLPFPALVAPSPLPLDFEPLRFDRNALHPERPRVFRVDLGRRAGSTRWDPLLEMPRYQYYDSYDKWFGPPKPLHSPR